MQLGSINCAPAMHATIFSAPPAAIIAPYAHVRFSFSMVEIMPMRIACKISESESMRKQLQLVSNTFGVHGTAKNIMRSVYCGISQNGAETATINKVNISWSRKCKMRLSTWCNVIRLDEIKCTINPEAKIINLCEKLYAPKNSGVAKCETA